MNENKQRRWLLNVFLLTLLAVFFAFVLSVVLIESSIIDQSTNKDTHAPVNTTEPPVVNASAYDSIDGEALEQSIHQKINQKRGENDIEHLYHSDRVRLIARLHSKDMAEREFFAHQNPDGLRSADRHQKYNGCSVTGENIIKLHSISGYQKDSLSRLVVDRWTDSQPHNKTLMSDRYHVTGVGVYVTEEGDLYVTQNFCREHPNA